MISKSSTAAASLFLQPFWAPGEGIRPKRHSRVQALWDVPPGADLCPAYLAESTRPFDLTVTYRTLLPAALLMHWLRNEPELQ